MAVASDNGWAATAAAVVVAGGLEKEQLRRGAKDDEGARRWCEWERLLGRVERPSVSSTAGELPAAGGSVDGGGARIC